MITYPGWYYVRSSKMTVRVFVLRPGITMGAPTVVEANMDGHPVRARFEVSIKDLTPISRLEKTLLCPA